MDNRKSILFLLNGFGIEKKDSYQIYSSELMPNLDKIINNHIFASIENKQYDYKEGYKLFAMGNNTAYEIVEKAIEDEFHDNKNLLEVINNVKNNSNRLHIFTILDSDKVVEQIKELIVYFREREEFEIYIQVLLKNELVENYSVIKKVMDSLRLLCGNYTKLDIGLTFGINNLYEESLIKNIYSLLVTGRGERWQEYDRKLDLLRSSNVLPSNAKPFFVKSDGIVRDKDTFLFLNYDDSSYKELIDMVDNAKEVFTKDAEILPSTIYKYSLFPMENTPNCKNLFDKNNTEESFVRKMQDMNKKILVITSEDRVNNINFYLNGSKQVKSEFLDFMYMNNELNIDAILKTDYSMIIFDYDIADAKTIDEVKEVLKDADSKLGSLYNYAMQFDTSLFISSLYGLYREYINEVKEKQIINFSDRIPVIVVDKLLHKTKYSISYGNTYDLSNTIIKVMNKETKNTLLVKKGGLFSFLRK